MTKCEECTGWYNPCAPDYYPDYIDDPNNCDHFEKQMSIEELETYNEL